MGMFDEFKQDAAKSGALLGGILAFVLFYLLWSISIWLVVLVAGVAAGAFFIFFRKRP